jgi:hypothetical protein
LALHEGKQPTKYSFPLEMKFDSKNSTAYVATKKSPQNETSSSPSPTRAWRSGLTHNLCQHFVLFFNKQHIQLFD